MAPHREATKFKTEWRHTEKPLSIRQNGATQRSHKYKTEWRHTEKSQVQDRMAANREAPKLLSYLSVTIVKSHL
jgi:hypothetical protein